MDIPDVLKPLVEFEEEDGTPIEWCDAECGWSTIDADDGMWLLPNRETGDNFFWTGDNPCHCPRCGAVLGVTDSYHKPYRIRFSKIVGEFSKVRDLLHDMETTDVTIAIQEREEARDQARAAVAALAHRDRALEQAQADLAHTRRALVEIAAKSPPDDWEWYEGAGDYAGYGRSGDPDYVEEPDITNSGDMHSHGWACGRWSAAKIARKAVAATERRKEG